MREDRSILDSITDEANDAAGAGSARAIAARLSEYLDNVREIERRIQRTESAQQRRRSTLGGAGRHSRVVRGARRR